MLLKRSSNNIISRWFWSIDSHIFTVVLVLLIIGVVLDISASPYVAMRLHAYPLYFVYRHLIYVVLAIITLTFVSFLDEQQVKRLSLIIFILAVLGIFLSLFIGHEIKGSKRWIHILGFSIQPSEFVKVCFPLILANIWTTCKKLGKTASYLIMAILYLCIVSIIIIQPDLGMTILLSTIFITVLFITEINFAWVFLLSIIGLIFLTVSYFSFAHVQYRINTFFSGDQSYQVTKALEAIKEGGFTGAGPGMGIVKKYLPDSHTDFIFAVSLEEYGVIFGIILICLYIYLFYRCFKLLAIENKEFNYISVTGLVITMAIQTFIHMSTNINLLPAKGVTLPFISYGGTSLIANAILIGFVLVLTKKTLK